MDEDDWLAGRFEENRPAAGGGLPDARLAERGRGRGAGSVDPAAGGGAGAVANLEGWFTTIVARVCLDMLRSRKSRPRGADRGGTEPRVAARRQAADPEQEAVLADSVGLALLVVLDTLAPAERVAFVLHDMFGLPFGEIAAITGRSPAAARQLASRARRRVQGPAGGPRGRRPGQAAGQSPTRSSPPRAAVTWARCSRCSTPRWCCTRTPRPCRRASRDDPRRGGRRPGSARRLRALPLLAYRAGRRVPGDRDGAARAAGPRAGLQLPEGKISRIDVIADPARLGARPGRARRLMGTSR